MTTQIKPPLRKPIFSWDEVWKTVDPASLNNTTVEVWYYPLAVMAGEVESELARESYRFVILEVDKSVSEYFPFKTADWRLYNKARGVWETCQPDTEALEIREETSLGGIWVENGRVRVIYPCLQLHVIFYNPAEPIPIKPRRAVTTVEIFENR